MIKETEAWRKACLQDWKAREKRKRKEAQAKKVADESQAREEELCMEEPEIITCPDGGSRKHLPPLELNAFVGIRTTVEAPPEEKKKKRADAKKKKKPAAGPGPAPMETGEIAYFESHYDLPHSTTPYIPNTYNAAQSTAFLLSAGVNVECQGVKRRGPPSPKSKRPRSTTPGQVSLARPMCTYLAFDHTRHWRRSIHISVVGPKRAIPQSINLPRSLFPEPRSDNPLDAPRKKYVSV